MVQIYLGHGAWGTPTSMAPWVDGLRAMGLEAAAVVLPRGRAERGIGPFAAQVPDVPGVVVGGHSLGGRVATLLAAGGEGRPARVHPVHGAVALSFPLHPPGEPARAAERVAHWDDIRVPVLLLAGDEDPYAPIERLRAAARRLRSVELVEYRGLGHDLSPVREDALERIATFVRTVTA